MGKRSVQYYVPSKNRRKRKHYWWRYLLVFILGQTLVLPGNLLLIGTAGTAATSMKLSTILQLAQQNPSQYLTDETMDSNIFQLIGQLTAKDADGNSALDSINSLNNYIKVKDIISQLATSINQPAVSALLTDDLYNTKFSEMGDYFTNKLEVAPLLEGAGLSSVIPPFVFDLLYNTPVAYFGQNVSNIKAVKGDVIDLSMNDFTILPASASNKVFDVTATDPDSKFSINGSSVTITNDDAIVVGQSYEFTATPADTTNDTVLPITFNIEVVDSLQCEKVTPYYDRDNQIIIWNNVDFASKYKVEYPTEWSKETTEGVDNFVNLKDFNLTDGTNYTLKITTIGKDDNHTTSDELSFEFNYTASPVTPDPDPQGGDGDGGKDDDGKGDGKSITREEDPQGGNQTPSQQGPVDTKGSYVGADGNPVEFNHPNGFDDETGKLIRKGLTISELGGAFDNILELLGDKTIGDLMSMFGGSSDSSTPSEPKIPVISKVETPTDIMGLFSSIKIGSLLGGGDGIMDALGTAPLGLLIPENTQDPDDIMNTLRQYTFGQLMNGEVDIMGIGMDSMLKGKTFRDLGFINETEGLLGMIADSCLINPDDYDDAGYSGPENVLDLFNRLTIGEALGATSESDNAILAALSDVPLNIKSPVSITISDSDTFDKIKNSYGKVYSDNTCSSEVTTFSEAGEFYVETDVGVEMSIRMGSGYSAVTDKWYDGKTVGQLLGMSAGNNAIMNMLIDCKLSADDLTNVMNGLTLMTVVGEDKILEYDVDGEGPVTDEDDYNYLKSTFGQLYLDEDLTTEADSFVSGSTYYYQIKFGYADISDESEFNDAIQAGDKIYVDPECTTLATTYENGAVYYLDGAKLSGIWSLMFDSVDEARTKPLTDIGDLFTKLGDSILTKSLNTLNELELLKLDGGTDLGSPLVMTVSIPWADIDTNLATAKAEADPSDTAFTYTVRLDSEGYKAVSNTYLGAVLTAGPGNPVYIKSNGEYVKVTEDKGAQTYYIDKNLGDYSLTDIIELLANLGSN